MPSVSFKNANGDSVDIYSSPFHLIAIEGLGGVEADIQMSKSPFQNGTTFIDSVLQPRQMSVELTIRGKDEADLAKNRRFFSNVFNPIWGLGQFEYHDVTGSKMIYAIPVSVPYYPDGQENRTSTMQKALVNLVAPNPMFTDVGSHTVHLEDYVANFSFPFHFPVSFAVRGDIATVYNEGHAPAPVRITFRGPALNPRITKVNTGEFIQINQDIPEGYSLVITTEFNDQSAYIYAPDGRRVDAMGYIDLSGDWNFFLLDVGENQLSFITDGGEPEVYVEYRTQYVGI